MKEVICPHVKGFISLYSVLPSGEWKFLHGQPNLITYQGMDVLAKSLSGAWTINTMYLVFENASVTKITADESNIYSTYTAAQANRSFVRVHTLGDAIYSSTDDAKYSGNVVEYLGVTDGTSYFPAIPVTDGTSSFYHTALVAAPDFDDMAQDQVFSCSNLTTAITKVAGAQLGIRWTLTFNNA